LRVQANTSEFGTALTMNVEKDAVKEGIVYVTSCNLLFMLLGGKLVETFQV